jgi:hypothetical protein
MIRRLRRRHLFWSAALVTLGPAIVLVATAARPDPSRLTVAALPGASAPPGEDAVTDSTFPVVVSLVGDPATGETLVATRPRGPIRVADPLLYLASSPPSAGGLPEGAVLVGPVGAPRPVAERLRLPSGPLTAILWSNAHRRVEAVAPLRQTGGAR